MHTINIQSDKDSYLIRIDKNAVNSEFMLRLVEWINLENLAQRVGIEDDITEIGEEIKASWWKENKDRFIPRGL